MTDYILLRGHFIENPTISFCRDFRPFCRGIFRTNNSCFPLFAVGNAAKELVDAARALAKEPGKTEEITLLGVMKQYPYKDTSGIGRTQGYIEVYGSFGRQKQLDSEVEQLLEEKEKHPEDWGILPVKVYEYQFKLREIMSGMGGAAYAEY